MDFYEPTCLFRQNAIRRPSSPGESMNSSEPQVFSYNSSNSSQSSSWLLQQNHAQDTLVMNKACSLDRVNIKSNYWKIPDTQMNLTAMAINDLAASVPLLAISSANCKNNLFIHELDTVNNYLTHHTTILLPNIHGLSWVPNTNSRFLISGNNKGYAHLVSIPRTLQDDEGVEESAEIIKRFNHRKHLKLVNKDPLIFSHGSTCISEMGFLSGGRLATCYDDTLFVWNMNDVELAMRPRPESISVVSGIRSFDPSVVSSYTVALCGTFGVSLFDSRSCQHSVPGSSFLTKSTGKQIRTNKVRWHPSNEHILASSQEDGVVRLWDVRKQDTFAELTGHQGKSVTSMSWNGNDLFTGGSDGHIVHWDLTSNLPQDAELSQHGDKLLKCSLREGINSVSFDPVSNSMVQRVNERQCGTPLPALNNKIVSMCPIVGSGPQDKCSILLIDGAAFLGLHCKIYDAANSASALESSEKQFYTPEDLRLIALGTSSETFVGSTDSLTRPLSIVKKTDTGLNESLEKNPVSLEKEPPSTPTTPVVNLVLDFVNSDFFSKWEQPLRVVSLHSVASLPDAEVSPYSSGMLDSDSNASFSTVATLIEPLDPVMHKDSLFNRLDLELERICDEFPGAF